MTDSTDAPAPQILDREDLERAALELGPEPTCCFLCDGRSFERKFERSGKSFWMCRGCELVFVHDIYPEFVTDTDHIGETFSFEKPRQADARKRKKFDRVLAGFEPYRKSGRLLEVGCGDGLFLAHARDRGWSVEGVDVLEPVVENARRVHGLDVKTGELADVGFADAAFDVVFTSEVIEHVVHPVPLLREVHRVLRPGGAAIFGTGNARSWAARMMGKRWSYYRFGGHMHIRYYCPRAAVALAKRAGFARARSRTSGFAFAEAGQLRGHWYRPLAKIAQGLLSPLASLAGAGHRLVMVLEKGDSASIGSR